LGKNDLIVLGFEDYLLADAVFGINEICEDFKGEVIWFYFIFICYVIL
jgi:hypothetical protein